MRALGIDPGVAACGISAVERQHGRARLVSAVTVRTKSDEPLDTRLKQIWAGVMRAIPGCDVVGVEDQHGPIVGAIRSRGLNDKSLDLLQVQGIACTIAWAFNRRLCVVNARHAKKMLAGSANADKASVKRAVLRLLDDGERIRISSHATDAATIAYATLRLSELNPVKHTG